MSTRNTRTPLFFGLAMMFALAFAFAISGCDKRNESTDSDDGTHQHSTDEHSLSQGQSVNASSKGDYPLATCVVSGDDLAAMGEYVSIQHEGREVRFCCKDCVRKFNRNPAKYVALLDKAARGESKSEHASEGQSEQNHDSGSSGHEDNGHDGHDH